MLLKSRAKEEFNIEPIRSEELDRWINECISIYRGNPSWIDMEDGIDSINMAKTVCSEAARLGVMGIGIHVSGSARADWLEKEINKINFREWLEYACAYGLIILKPNGKDVDLYLPGEYEITHISSGKIDGIVFHNCEKVGDKWHTRLEYHRFENERYVITNKCYVGDTPSDTKETIDISLTPWAGMAEEVHIQNVEKPLFAPLRTPQANNIVLNSPVGLPLFSEAIQELRDLDIAYSRNATEIFDSKRTVMVDESLIAQTGMPVAQSSHAMKAQAKQRGLPDMVKIVRGDGLKSFYQEINPTLHTEERLKGLNALISQIGFKVGFSNGYFVFNEKTGMVTATQVESDDRRTIQLIKDIREKLEDCIRDLAYALTVFADLYGLTARGTYEVTFDFGDITYNREEDRARWWGYVQSGKVPAWMYFVKFEGMPEEEAKAMVAEAQPVATSLFGS